MQRRPSYLRSENGAIPDRWLISYTDIVTILLILFVSVAAQAMKPHITESKPAPEQRKPLRETAAKLQKQGLDARLEPRGLVISLPQAVLFASGDDSITPLALPTLSKIAAAIQETSNKVVLVGHADTIPIHNQRFKSNWELSSARSLSLLARLASEYGIPEARFSIESDGSNSPRDSNETESGRAANRRVEILLLDAR